MSTTHENRRTTSTAAQGVTTTVVDRCCDHSHPCPDCEAKTFEVRAARRDALVHLVASSKPRRARSIR